MKVDAYKSKVFHRRALHRSYPYGFQLNYLRSGDKPQDSVLISYLCININLITSLPHILLNANTQVVDSHKSKLQLLRQK